MQSTLNRLHRALAFTIVLLAGCATLPSPAPVEVPGDPAAAACLNWYANLDRTIDAAGVRDAGETRIAGFPHLRADRFAASFRDMARTDAVLRKTLFQTLADLDLRARQIELTNLPPSTRPDASGLGACSRALVALDLSGPRSSALLDRLAVPDDYSTIKRVMGAYAVTAIPFFAGVTRWQDDTQAVFAAAKNREDVRRHVPAAPVGANPLATAVRDAMGVPALTPQEWQSLLARHTPVLDIVARSRSDRFGALQWQAGEIGVEPESPIAYTRVAFTRFHGETLVQLIYTFWFPERPLTGPFDPLGGRLDGLMVRITLDRDGTLLMVDSIHACGCYQLFFPSPRLSPRAPPDPNIEWAFVPKRLPPVRDGERVALRIASGTHYLEDIDVANVTPGDETYALASEHRLRSLPLPDGSFRSVYSPDGLIPGSERGERFLFWPMGIASPGAMRQWGRHATAFVGRRHFDDADLIERRFERVK